MTISGVLFLLWVIVVAFWMLNQFNSAQRRAEKKKKLRDSMSV
jgi:hypothetical protein